MCSSIIIIIILSYVRANNYLSDGKTHSILTVLYDWFKNVQETLFMHSKNKIRV